MIDVSNEYKVAMEKPIRNRCYVSIGIGVVNQEAQENAKISSILTYWSKGDIFDNSIKNNYYATMEENYFLTDGTMYFLPENDEDMQLKNNGISTIGIMEPLIIKFGETYSIKGLTIDFGVIYPVMFQIETEDNIYTYSNESSKFITNDSMGDTSFIIITPLEMVGGNQRLHVKNILMGVGLTYSNKQTKSLSINEYVSTISAELPNLSFNYSFYDEENNFDVDNENSFIDFLETMQRISISFGIELDSEIVEWHKIATTYLKDWKSQKGIVSINATDRLSQMEDEYTLANKIYERTAYEEAESIFIDAGLQSDEYYIDEHLRDVILYNPMPIGMHKECLQILANACRCIIRQDENGRITIKPNFATVIGPSDLDFKTNGVADWSKPQNLIDGTDIVYADMTNDFFKTDGSMYFLPEDRNYLDTSYISKQISDEYGLFEEKPTITINLSASYSYFGMNINFDGNYPKEMTVYTYNLGVLKEVVNFEITENNTKILHEFLSFDKMVIEFSVGHPNNRVLVNQISFGDLSDYILTKRSMLESPVGYKEKRVKSVKVKIFNFEYDENNIPQEVVDNNYYEKTIGEVGETKILENPLVSTEEHASLLADWIGNYYSNNISYDVKYRGEPRINASDIIRMESDKKNNLQVEITSHSLNFNGALSGSLELRRALNMSGG